jgi:hypothetical protein
MATNFNISEFRSKIQGGARPNQFSVSIIEPNGLRGRLNNITSITPFLISVAELPGQTIGVTPVYYRGREIKLAGDKVFAPFTCTVLNDETMIIRDYMEKWMQYIENNTSKGISGVSGITNPTQYLGQILVNQLDRQGNTLRAYRLIDAFPSDISPIGLDFSANDQMSTFSITFQYQTFTINSSLGDIGIL